MENKRAPVWDTRLKSLSGSKILVNHNGKQARPILGHPPAKSFWEQIHCKTQWKTRAPQFGTPTCKHSLGAKSLSNTMENKCAPVWDTHLQTISGSKIIVKHNAKQAPPSLGYPPANPLWEQNHCKTQWKTGASQFGTPTCKPSLGAKSS